MSKMGQELEDRLDENKYELYKVVEESVGRLTHTSECNSHRFDRMTPLAEKTMIDCGYNNNCDCGLQGIIRKREQVLAKIEG